MTGHDLLKKLNQLTTTQLDRKVISTHWESDDDCSGWDVECDIYNVHLVVDRYGEDVINLE